MTATIEIHADLEARGRNGWFTPEHAKVWHFEHDGCAEVEVWSKREGDTAPMLIRGPQAELLALFRAIVQKLEATA